MPRPLSNDIRIRVVQSYEAGDVSYREVSERFEVAFNCVVRWVSQFRKEGHVSPRPIGGSLPKIREEQLDELKALIAEKPDRTLTELATIWNQQHGTDIHPSSIDRALQRANITRKKNFPSFRAFTR